mmetsp:Transcript_52547/g.139966  ORF Transcript_52547/g.139966 Transcript_52547/m.139966 type:complete len:1342 (-) Transcript_52547:86-4111(-)
MIDSLLFFSVVWIAAVRVHAEDLEVKLGITLPLFEEAGFSQEAESMRRGLELLEATVNSEKPYTTATGRTLTVNIRIEDDLASVETATTLYESMLAEQRLLLGSMLYSSEALEQMSEVAVSITPLDPVNTSNFYVTPHPAGYIPTMSTDDVAIVYKDIGYYRALCEGLLDRIEALGGTATIFSFDASETLLASLEDSDANFIRSQQIPVYACLPFDDLVDLIVFGYSQRWYAMNFFATSVMQPDFYRAMTPARANYRGGPMTWAENMERDSTCNVFGNAQGFAEKFREMYANEPSYHSAEAAAAAMTLLAAVRNLDNATPSNTDLRAELATLSEPSFYGTLEFHSSGYSVVETFAGQLQPYPESAEKTYRWLNSNMAVVTLATSFPTPQPDEQALEIYPCGDGSYVSSFSITEAVCSTCPAGRYRDSFSTRCRSCEEGTYADSTGNIACQECPEGSSCPTYGTTQPMALEGWYLMPEQDMTFLECEAPLCKGENVCHGESTGILCGSCNEGYTHSLSRGGLRLTACVECGSLMYSLCLICLMFLFWIGVILLVYVFAGLSAGSDQSLGDVILKIILTYLQLTSIAIVGCGWSEHLVVLRLLVSLFKSPTEMVDVHCLLSPDAKEIVTITHMRSALGILIFPGLWLIAYCVFRILKLIRSRTFDMAALAAGGNKEEYLKDREMEIAAKNSDSSDSDEEKEELEEKKELEEEGEEEDVDGAADELENIQYSRTVDTEEPRKPFFSAAQLKHLKRLNARRLDTKYQTLQVMSAVTFVLYPFLLSEMSLSAQCVNKEVLRLYSELDILCFSEENYFWYVGSLSCTVVYGLGIPIFIFYKLSTNLKNSGGRKFYHTYRLWTNGFYHRYSWYEMVILVYKFCAIMTLCIPARAVRVPTMVIVNGFALCLSVRLRPFEIRGFFVLDRLHIWSLIAVLATILPKLYTVMTEDFGLSAASVIHDPLKILMWFFCGLFHARVLSLSLWALFRNIITKHVMFRQFVLPKETGALGRIILRMERYKKCFEYDETVQGLALDELSRQEKTYLLAVLNETLDMYVMHCSEFHPGFLMTAVKIAMKGLVAKRVRLTESLVAMHTYDHLSFWQQRRHDMCVVTGHIGSFEVENGIDPENMSLTERQRYFEKISQANARRATALANAKKTRATPEDILDHLIQLWPKITSIRETPEHDLTSILSSMRPWRTTKPTKTASTENAHEKKAYRELFTYKEPERVAALSDPMPNELRRLDELSRKLFGGSDEVLEFHADAEKEEEDEKLEDLAEREIGSEFVVAESMRSRIFQRNAELEKERDELLVRIEKLKKDLLEQPQPSGGLDLSESEHSREQNDEKD